MSSSAITTVTGRAIVLRGNDIDTDRIIPARFLKTVTFEGLEANVFFDDRAAMARDGAVHPFDAPASTGASILIVNKNFGCGSSREHAPQALHRRGIRAVVAESFADIFFSNSLMIGLACVCLGAEDVGSLMKIVEGDSAAVVAVDLESGVATAAGKSWPAQIPAHARHALTSGQWDGAGLLLENYAEVEAVGARLPYSF